MAKFRLRFEDGATGDADMRCERELQRIMSGFGLSWKLQLLSTVKKMMGGELGVLSHHKTS